MISIRVKIQEGTSYQKAMEVFNYIAKCYYVVVDKDIVKNQINSKLTHIPLPLLDIPDKSIEEYIDGIIEILMLFECVDYTCTQLEITGQKDKKVVKFSEYLAVKYMNEKREGYGKLFLKCV